MRRAKARASMLSTGDLPVRSVGPDTQLHNDRVGSQLHMGPCPLKTGPCSLAPDSTFVLRFTVSRASPPWVVRSTRLTETNAPTSATVTLDRGHRDGLLPLSGELPPHAGVDGRGQGWMMTKYGHTDYDLTTPYGDSDSGPCQTSPVQRARQGVDHL
ncbi:hypothetical protein HD554DRAFT_268792 [Boletus coccyginus]|nr:hypothetical protein HD554DRAFT_268792 [Boletus coccyginus]